MIDISHSASYIGDCRDLLAQLPERCIQTCVTSPPYWGLRDYGVEGQLGLEQSPHEYVANMVEVFRGVRRVLRDDGTLWLNLGDTFVNKCLVGIPWQVALALIQDGWVLRSEVIWSKTNAMPDPTRDRLCREHEQLFLLAKSRSYFFDVTAIRVPYSREYKPGAGFGGFANRKNTKAARLSAAMPDMNRTGLGANATISEDGKRNRGDVWEIATEPLAGSHFAAMPSALVEPCILAGSKPGDIVLDPFFGSGTTGMVAEKHGRKWIGFDLNPEYKRLQDERTAQRSLVLP